jgi:pilus assembly protein CpaB
LLIASILTAALGTALIWLYVQGADTRAQASADLVPALFLTGDLKAGQPVGAAVVVKRVPPDVAAGAYTELAAVQGLKLSADARAGQVLLKNMVSANATGGKRFPKGGAVALAFSQPNLVPADLRVDDTVDVLAFAADGKVETVVKDIKVRTIGTNVASGSTAPAPAAPNGAANGAGQAPIAGGGIALTVVGFDATPEQAELLYGILAKGQQPALYLKEPAATK